MVICIQIRGCHFPDQVGEFFTLDSFVVISIHQVDEHLNLLWGDFYPEQANAE